MSITHDNGAKPTGTERAEQKFDNIGYRIGYLAGTATQRLEHVVSNMRVPSLPQITRTDQGNHRESPSPRISEEDTQQAFIRAEELVQHTEQRVGQWSAFLSQRSQRLVARMREDLEDLWAEAQHVRQTKQRP
jgi:hypothetical protein